MSFVLQQLTDPAVQLCAWVLIGTIAAELLVAIWAAVGPQHWFWRGLGLWAAVMVMVPIGAWQSMWVLVFTAGFVVGIVQLGRAVERWRLRIATREGREAGDVGAAVTRYRYSLGDLLLAVFLICLWLPGMVTAGRESQGVNWWGLLAVAAVWAGLAVMAAKLAFGPRRWRAVVALAIGLPLAAFAFLRTAGPAGFWLYVFGDGNLVEEIALVVLFELALVLVIVGVIRLVCVIRAAATPPTTRLWAKGILAAAIGFAAVGVGYVYAKLLERAPAAVKFELPGNQFGRIVEIAQRVNAINRANEPMGEIRLVNANVPKADELAALYAELLPLLAGENAVEYDPEGDAKSRVTQVVPFSMTIRGLCRSLEAESKWARSKGQPDVAGDYALACLGLSESLGRGGVALDALISRSIEGPGYVQLAMTRGELSADKLREALAALARDAGRRDDVETVRARELDFGERVDGFLTRFEHTLWKLKGRDLPWVQSLNDVSQRHKASNAVLRAELAAELFEREKGRRANRLEELVPEYLPAVPADVYRGGPLRWKVEAESGRLVFYSVGRDGVDDGGRFTDWQSYSAAKGEYDFDVETLVRK